MVLTNPYSMHSTFAPCNTCSHKFLSYFRVLWGKSASSCSWYIMAQDSPFQDLFVWFPLVPSAAILCLLSKCHVYTCTVILVGFQEERDGTCLPLMASNIYSIRGNVRRVKKYNLHKDLSVPKQTLPKLANTSGLLKVGGKRRELTYISEELKRVAWCFGD